MRSDESGRSCSNKWGPTFIPDMIAHFRVRPQVIFYIVQQGGNPSLAAGEMLMPITLEELIYAAPMYPPKAHLFDWMAHTHNLFEGASLYLREGQSR